MDSMKGISPIIASVLLVAVSLGVVGVFSGWAPELIQSITDQTSNQTEERIECDQASMEIISAFHDSNTTVSMRNRGDVDLDEVTLVAFNSQDTIQTQANTSLSKGDVINVTLETGSQPNTINAYSTKCGSVTATTDDIGSS